MIEIERRLFAGRRPTRCRCRLNSGPRSDVNFNGSTLAPPDPPFNGYSDVPAINLSQIGARAGAYGFSGGGGGFLTQGGGVEQDSDMANSTADPPTALTPTQVSHTVALNWTAPSFGQMRNYYLWKTTGSFPTLQSIITNLSKFTRFKTMTGTPPLTTYTDTSVKNKTTYTYFVTDSNKLTAQSGPSTPVVITVVF